MADVDESGPLAGQVIFIVGTLMGLTKRACATLIGARGGSMVSKPSRRITSTVVAHDSLRRVMRSDGSLVLPAALQAAVVGEVAFKRLLAISPSETAPLPYSFSDLQRLSDLEIGAVEAMIVF